MQLVCTEQENITVVTVVGETWEAVRCHFGLLICLFVF